MPGSLLKHLCTMQSRGPLIAQFTDREVVVPSIVSSSPIVSQCKKVECASQLVHRAQAVPSKVAPMFLTGNLGEVLLLGSLVASEGILRSQGL